MRDPTSLKVVRNDPCPCGSGKNHKKCHGSVAKGEGRERASATAAASRVVASTNQAMATQGYGPQQFTEMIRNAEQVRKAR